MRKRQKEQVQEFIRLLNQAHEEIKKYIEASDIRTAMALLAQCQEGAMEIGTLIETTEGEGFITISHLESYCETVYLVHEKINQGGDLNARKIYKKLRRTLLQVENSIRNDIKQHFEMVFLPYKASMWDSLESVWQAAAADSDCNAYVVPVPYYDKNPDGSLGTYHYEGNDFPVNVPIIHYDTYLLEERKPDAIYIHNPYDDMNYVTSVDPRFYSGELKKHTECLVYIPYYSTSGGMAEGQARCPAYYNADHIIIQAEKYRRFFDPALPKEKLVPLGSPKFDKVVHMCANPPEPPAPWKEKMAGRKVYFYNTSLQGMLANTEAFLKKMEYVFGCFRGREDVCLLWRPHPLMESTLDSMRPMYRPVYDALRNSFISEGFGIYDDTPDIESTIALSDAYIGDSATSVTALFGIAGKPLFILNNCIHTLPEKDDWRGEVVNIPYDVWEDDRYHVMRGNQLWFSENNDYHYRFYMDLGTGYSGGGYYTRAVELKGKIYVLPGNARNLLVIQDKKIRKIEFKAQIAQPGAFYSYWYTEKYIFLFPYQYPFLIRFNIETEEIHYVDGIRQFNVRNVEGEWRTGGICPYGNNLAFASPEDNGFLFLDMDTLKVRGESCNSSCNLGTQGIVPDGDDLWLLPLNGMTLTCWNPKTGDIREYSDLPQGFKSIKWPYEVECREHPFGGMAFSKEKIVISPFWGNMYLSLDRETGRMEEWEPPIPFRSRGKNGYFVAATMGGFLFAFPRQGKADCRIWYAPERKLYDINIETKEYREVEIEFEYNDLKRHEPGFMEESEWLQYCLNENAFNSLKDFLDGNINGNRFDREKQLKAFSKVNADTEGTCGEKIYRFMCEKSRSGFRLS